MVMPCSFRARDVATNGSTRKVPAAAKIARIRTRGMYQENSTTSRARRLPRPVLLNGQAQVNLVRRAEIRSRYRQRIDTTRGVGAGVQRQGGCPIHDGRGIERPDDARRE